MNSTSNLSFRVLLCIALLAGVASAATCRIQVTVRDSKGTPLDGIPVDVRHDPGGRVETHTTSKTGSTRIFKAAKDGTLTITPRPPGVGKSRPVSVRADRHKVAVLVLAPSHGRKLARWQLKERSLVDGALTPRVPDLGNSRRVPDLRPRPEAGRNEKPQPGPSTRPTPQGGWGIPGRPQPNLQAKPRPQPKPQPKPQPETRPESNRGWPRFDLDREQPRLDLGGATPKPKPRPSPRPSPEGGWGMPGGHRLPGTVQRIDSEALLQRKLSLGGVIGDGRLEQFAHRRVQTGPDQTMTLSELVRTALPEQERLRRDARLAASRGLLAGAPEYSDRVIELAQEFLIERRTRIVVRRPRELAQLLGHDSEFARFLGAPTVQRPGTGSNAATPQKLDRAAVRAGIAKFRREELPTLATDHPLRQAAARGDEALLDAIREGQGDFEVTETLSAPKSLLEMRAGVAQAPQLREGAFDHARMRPWTPDGVRSHTDLGAPGLGAPDLERMTVRERYGLPRLAVLREVVAGHLSTGRGLDGRPRGSIATAQNGRAIATDDRGNLMTSGNELVLHLDPIGRDRLALRCGKTGRYVTIGRGSRLCLGNDAAPGASETFTLERRDQIGGATYLLRSTSRNRLVGIAPQGGLVAAAERAGEASAFRFETSRWQPTLSGRVVDGSGHGIQGITVDVTGERGTRTNGQGAFSSAASYGHRVTITPRHDRYRFVPASRTVTADREIGSLEFRVVDRVTEQGRAEFRTQFLAGDTKGTAWEWEKRWNYPSGFFRISLGAHYLVGLRIPLEVSGSVTPGTIHQEGTPRSLDYDVEVTARTLDADSGFYRRLGLDEHKVSRGREAVLAAGFYWGMKFRVFWSDVIYVPRRDVGFDYGKDFQPPLAGRGRFERIMVPASMTGTSFNWGVLWGQARVGAELGGRNSRVLLDLEARPLDQDAGTLHLDGRHPVRRTFRLPRPRSAGATPYGFILSKPRYRTEVTITPGIDVDVGVGIDGFSRTFSTGWVPLRRFALGLGTLDLGHHPGTPRAFSFMEPTRVFR